MSAYPQPQHERSDLDHPLPTRRSLRRSIESRSLVFLMRIQTTTPNVCHARRMSDDSRTGEGTGGRAVASSGEELSAWR